MSARVLRVYDGAESDSSVSTEQESGSDALEDSLSSLSSLEGAGRASGSPVRVVLCLGLGASP